jgi:D-3-phosphoglycerate dehydrogenase
MNPFKILIINQLHEVLIQQLEQKGFHVDYLPDISVEQIFECIEDYQGIVIRSKLKIDSAFLNKATNLKFVARAGAGIDQIDLEELAKRNIKIFNAPEGNRNAVGEHTLGMLLCLLNKIHLGDTEVRQKIWQREENRGYEVRGKTVGIIGYGNMGKAFSRCLQGFQTPVLAYDNAKVNYGDQFAKEVGLEELFAKTDILSLHIPLNKQNYHFIDADFLNKFKKPIYLLNMARGQVLSLEAVQENLENGKILGTCLDVLENEKLETLTPKEKEIFNYLTSSNKTLFTPHVGGWTVESYRKISETLAQKITDSFKSISKKQAMP